MRHYVKMFRIEVRTRVYFKTIRKKEKKKQRYYRLQIIHLIDKINVLEELVLYIFSVVPIFSLFWCLEDGMLDYQEHDVYFGRKIVVCSMVKGVPQVSRIDPDSTQIRNERVLFWWYLLKMFSIRGAFPGNGHLVFLHGFG